MNRRDFLATTLAGAIAAAAPGAAGAGDVITDTLEITGAFTRAAPKTAMAGAGFLTIRSRGGADRLLGFTSPWCERPELHTHINDADGIMRMRRVEAIDIPAGGEAQLKPGGLHMMFIKLTGQLIEGEQIDATLIFEQAGEVPITLPVKGPGARE